MRWVAVESSALQAAAYAETQAPLYLLFQSGEVTAIPMYPSGSIGSFWRRIPKAGTSDATFGAASDTSAYAGRGNRRAASPISFPPQRDSSHKILVTDKTESPIIVFGRRAPDSPHSGPS
jgi:hypothetical protein